VTYIHAGYTGFRSGMFSEAMINPADDYKISLKGIDFLITESNKDLFDKVEVGDRLLVGIRKEFDSEYDYLPPDYTRKVLIKKTPKGYSLVSAIRLNDTLESLL
jgi:hypothetical protein